MPLYTFIHSLLNVLVQIANKMGLQTTLILPAALRPGGSQPLTEMSTGSRKIIFVGSKVRSVRRADNLTTICEPIV
jgi:hypothetical protein